MAVYKVAIHDEYFEAREFLVSAMSQSAATNAVRRHVLKDVSCETLSADDVFNYTDKNITKLDAMPQHKVDGDHMIDASRFTPAIPQHEESSIVGNEPEGEKS